MFCRSESFMISRIGLCASFPSRRRADTVGLFMGGGCQRPLSSATARPVTASNRDEARRSTRGQESSHEVGNAGCLTIDSPL